MLRWIVPLLIAGWTQTTPPWTPPEDPDPHEILQEARQDARAGRHAVALAKHLWFHRNALRHQPALSGVRLSFALSDWHDLAQQYPPALEALRQVRDEALASFEDAPVSDEGFFAFLDFASINTTLGEDAATVAVFVRLDIEGSPAAERVYSLAEPALIRGREYQLCGKYLRPARDWDDAAAAYHMGRAHQERFGPQHAEFVEQAFTYRVATLVSLLVVTDRQAEAEEIASKARAEWDRPAFHAAIDSALEGEVPEVWP